jgi:hypothetical protein
MQLSVASKIVFSQKYIKTIDIKQMVAKQPEINQKLYYKLRSNGIVVSRNINCRYKTNGSEVARNINCTM